ncbi:MAG: hemerythrin domain-containing protein [Fibrobacteres bacterium]|jgi:hemerythrin superfamily protein|nr:hemerythrin domain-containing protein [Fibrobacterota bacterium]
MDLYKLLHEDHQKVKSLLNELEDTTERAEKSRERLIKEVEMELTIHSEAEEKFFYPRLREMSETKDLAYEALEEHKVVKTLLTELVSEPKGTDEWTAKLSVLKENVEHHIEEEEGPLFSKAKRSLAREDAEMIGDSIMAYKEEHAEVEAEG